MIGEPNAQELENRRYVERMRVDLDKAHAEPELLTVEFCHLQAKRWQAKAELIEELEKPEPGA